MTYASLKSQLSAYLPTGIVQFKMGWLWELNLNRDGADEYPLIFVEMPNIPRKTRAKKAEYVTVKVDIYFLYYWDRNTSSTDKTVIYDNINTLSDAYFQTLNANQTNYLTLTDPDNIIVELIPDGIVTDWALGIKYTAEFKMFC